MWGRDRTRIPPHVDGVTGVARVGTRAGALGLALFPVHQ